MYWKGFTSKSHPLCEGGFLPEIELNSATPLAAVTGKADVDGFYRESRKVEC